MGKGPGAGIRCRSLQERGSGERGRWGAALPPLPSPLPSPSGGARPHPAPGAEGAGAGGDAAGGAMWAAGGGGDREGQELRLAVSQEEVGEGLEEGDGASAPLLLPLHVLPAHRRGDVLQGQQGQGGVLPAHTGDDVLPGQQGQGGPPAVLGTRPVLLSVDAAGEEGTGQRGVAVAIGRQGSGGVSEDGGVPGAIGEGGLVGCEPGDVSGDATEAAAVAVDRSVEDSLRLAGEGQAEGGGGEGAVHRGLSGLEGW